MAISPADYDREVIDEIIARDAIRWVLSAYARGIDRADAVLLKSCYHADAIEEHGGNFHGNAHDYVDQAMPRVRGMGVMQHLLGTSHIDLNADTAYVETYIWTFARFHPSGKPPVTRLSIPLPAGQVLAGGGGPAISRDGRTLERLGNNVPGSPEAPITWDGIAEKFGDCASVSAVPLSADKIRTAKEMANNLERLDDATALIRVLT